VLALQGGDHAATALAQWPALPRRTIVRQSEPSGRAAICFGWVRAGPGRDRREVRGRHLPD
jgi:hypothetical protein